MNFTLTPLAFHVKPQYPFKTSVQRYGEANKANHPKNQALDILTLTHQEEVQAAHIQKALHETWKSSQNGLQMSGLTIRNETNTPKDTLLEEIVKADGLLKKSLPQHAHIKTFVSADAAEPNYFVLSNLNSAKGIKVLNTQTDSTLGLAKSVKSIFGYKIAQESLKHLRHLGDSHPHSVIQTLISEYLSEQGEPSIPKILKDQVLNTSSHKLDKTSNLENRGQKGLGTAFSDRIDVNSYTYFEYVHPAYARQVTVMADMIQKYAPKANKAIDIGTGPGSALKFLHELQPNLNIQAIEPDKEAFDMLAQTFKGNKSITPVHVDFLKHQGAKVPLAVSTGASHHLDTYDFFKKAYELLENNGVLIVADEMLSPFKSLEERQKNLILHHVKYMLNIMHEPPKNAHLTPDEKKLVSILHTNMPKAYHLAVNNQVKASERLLKQTDATLRTLDLKPDRISHPNIAFYRLQFLELQALTAGLDYQVEQKTFPDQLKRMAEQAGFRTLEHQRVYPTHGDKTTDAGTHVIAFQKLTPQSNASI